METEDAGPTDVVMDVRKGGISLDLERVIFRLELAFPAQPRAFTCTPQIAGRLMTVLTTALQQLEQQRQQAGMSAPIESTTSEAPHQLQKHVVALAPDGSVILRLQAGPMVLDLAMSRDEARDLGWQLQHPGRRTGHKQGSPKSRH